MKYSIDYEALVYNIPEIENFEFMKHKFVVNTLTKDDERIILPEKDLLKANFAFLSCCSQYKDGHSSYITLVNKTTLEISFDEISTQELQIKVQEIVVKQVDEIEQFIIFITNLHIFFPVVKIKIHSDDDSVNIEFCYTNPRPIPASKWNEMKGNINIERRLNYNINKDLFNSFRFHKNHTRYCRSFEYYIQSFFQYDQSTAFCLLCSAIDAITGKNDSNKTKYRLAKYSSVLLCEPLEICKIKDKMENYYKLRSNFIHGKGSYIEARDAEGLREYVRKFLMAYFLFWQEMRIKHEPQMLQKLDEIFEDHSLYVKYVPASYTFISMLSEHEQSPDGILQKTVPEKGTIALIKLLEALINPTSTSNSEKSL